MRDRLPLSFFFKKPHTIQITLRSCYSAYVIQASFHVQRLEKPPFFPQRRRPPACTATIQRKKTSETKLQSLLASHKELSSVSAVDKLLKGSAHHVSPRCVPLPTVSTTKQKTKNAGAGTQLFAPDPHLLGASPALSQHSSSRVRFGSRQGTGWGWRRSHGGAG